MEAKLKDINIKPKEDTQYVFLDRTQPYIY